MTGAALAPSLVRAQQQQSFGGPGYMHALDLEQQDHYAEAAAAYKEVLARDPTSLPALLGLERVYAQLGRSDSLLPIVDAAITRQPHAAAIRTIKLRTLHSLGRFDQVRAAFEQWRTAWPHDPEPYRAYAKLLIQDGLTAPADSVLRSGTADLGSARPFAYELAQLRAAMGQWEQSAAAWRVAVADNTYLDQAAVFSLAPVSPDVRPRIRAVLTAPPPTVASRRILAGLELNWGSPHDGWLAIKDLPPDSAAVDAWLDFARRAEDAQSWLAARDALVAAFARQRTPEVAGRAATDALSGGDARSAVMLASQAESLMDSSTAASSVLAVHLRALSILGRPADGERLLTAYASHLDPDQRDRFTKDVAWGWIRMGDMAKAKALLASSGLDVDGEAEGWIALYQGDLATARKRLRVSDDVSSPQLVLALSLLQRTKVDSAPAVGQAFLALARADTAAAATAFEQAANAVPDATTLLLATAAQLDADRHDARAVTLWQLIVQQHADAPEAPEAELAWARALRRSGQTKAAVDRLEHLILTYPQSALVPQARRELDELRGAVPSTS
jgi:tetratricopeptide (TPR) repeat protein